MTGLDTMKIISLDIARDKIYLSIDQRVEKAVSVAIYLEAEDASYDADGPQWAGHRVRQVYRAVESKLRWESSDPFGFPERQLRPFWNG
jgi:hypothetical protein